MKRILILTTVISIIFHSGCKKINKTEEEPYKGKDYFPVNVGHELVYDVKHIIFDDFSQTWDTSQYQIREVIAGTYNDNEGRETQRIERYIDNDTTPGFIIYKVYAANLLTSTAQREEDNIRYIKLYFPQDQSKNWDANSLNTLGGRYYKYTSLHEPLSINGLSFDSTCTVLQLKDSDLTKNLYFEEKYATNVGMIYKINQEIHYSSFNVVASASVYTETLNSFIK